MNSTELLAALTEWMPAQRWFAGKGTRPSLRLIGSYDLGPGLTTALVLDEGGQQAKLYQVPLVVSAEPRTEDEGSGSGGSFIARISADADSSSTATPSSSTATPSSGTAAPSPNTAAPSPSPTATATVSVYDAPHDVRYAHALLALITGDAATPGDGAITATGRSQVPGHPLVAVSAKVLSGEQSNTSIIMGVETPEGEAAAPVICKVFRVLHHGNNPDVVLQSALAAAGSTRVPASVGSIVGQWNDSRLPDGRTSGHLAFAQEFLPGVRDAWRVALDAASAGQSFTAEAAALGDATAEVHETLAAVMPTVAPSPDLVAGVLSSMRRRHAGAVREVPDLAAHGDAIARVFEKAAAIEWPRLQRIHGDYHLGQVLAVPGGGWVLVDFEGEPLRPMVERNQPDLALRDIAGMLRSFDYVAGSHAHSHPGESAADWATDARTAFLDAYVARSGLDLEAMRPLLDALEIDKALYEAIYEARNRPDWLPIPTTAIARLAASAG
ncbi:maltokinase N-terminal cap-like domain-containing protein [Subtercola sp. YIM 133946]|uniref:maltokinase N-terminal cap-like domain-containing protein n=1 Tax=Subtercola sp. YIM 133946 TaxID=3118909 RepID=UPI002F947F3F